MARTASVTTARRCMPPLDASPSLRAPSVGRCADISAPGTDLPRARRHHGVVRQREQPRALRKAVPILESAWPVRRARSLLCYVSAETASAPRKILCVAPNPVSYTYDAVARSWGQTRQRREGEEPPALDCLRVAMPSVAQTMKAKVRRAPLVGPTRVDSWGAPCWWGGWESGRAQCCARVRCVHAIAARRGGLCGTPPTEVLTCTP